MIPSRKHDDLPKLKIDKSKNLFLKFLPSVLYNIYKLCSLVGICTVRFLFVAVSFVIRLGELIGPVAVCFFGVFTRPVSKWLSRVPIKKVVKNAVNTIKEHGFFGTAKLISHKVKSNSRDLKKSVCYIAPCVAFAIMLVTVSVWTGVTYALKVNLDGKDLGCVSSEEVYTQAVDLFNSRVVVPLDTPNSVSTPEFSLQVATESKLKNSEQIFKSLVQMDSRYEDVCGIYVNGSLKAYADDKKLAQASLDRILEKYNTNSPDERVAFYNDISLEQGLYSKAVLDNIEPIDSVAEKNEYTLINYTVQKDENLDDIAEKFNSTTALLEAVNSDSSIKEGDSLNVVGEQPIFSVKVIRNVVSNETIPFSTIRVDNQNLKKDEVSLVQRGLDGIAKVTTEVVYVNGEMVENKLISEQTLMRPIDEQVMVGAKEEAQKIETPITMSSPDINLVGLDGFCWPLDASKRNYISAYYGDGRGHQGMDIAAPIGVGILAAADGTVVSINNMGSAYGLHIVVDHGNGVTTLYAHCSQIFVQVGQKVSQGEVLAAIGSTGRSTGPHLHFEVRIDGNPVNPAPYLGA